METPLEQKMIDTPFNQLDQSDAPLRNHIAHPLLCPSTLSCIAAPFLCCICPFVAPCVSCQTVAVKEEKVLLSWGKYHATLKEPGCYCINPVAMTAKVVATTQTSSDLQNVKVADGTGNPLLLSGVVTYYVQDTKKAALDVANHDAFVRTQGTAVMKQVASLYPYETSDGKPSLKTEASHLRSALVEQLQARVDVAGVRIINFEFNDLAYSPEIAQVMLVRQQAAAMVDARKVIADGAVGIVKDTISNLEAANIILSEREKVSLASNLVVSICSEGGTVRTVNVGS
jgi:regulator of protease activity HflC (stomatin/prohibitin superfamily)